MKKLIVNCKYPLKFNYYVTDTGKIWSEKTQKFLREETDKDGYKKVQLVSLDLPPKKRHRYSIHRLMMENFFPFENMEKYQVNHIDGNKSNNFLSNLEWVTPQENIEHAIKNGLRAPINGSAKLTEKEVLQIIKLLKEKKYTNVELGKMFNLHPDSIGRIKNKKSWKHLTKNIKF